MTDNKEPGWAKIRNTQAVDDLVKYGPSIEVGIAPIPFGTGRRSALAQIDTGAGGTAISPRLARKLNLKPVAKGTAHQAGLPPITAQYFRVRLFLPSTDIEMEVVGFATLNPPHDVLIGRDVLANCRLAVDFLSGVTCLHIKSS
jgi:predicted aspartyl protease